MFFNICILIGITRQYNDLDQCSNKMDAQPVFVSFYREQTCIATYNPSLDKQRYSMYRMPTIDYFNSRTCNKWSTSSAVYLKMCRVYSAANYFHNPYPTQAPVRAVTTFPTRKGMDDDTQAFRLVDNDEKYLYGDDHERPVGSVDDLFDDDKFDAWVTDDGKLQDDDTYPNNVQREKWDVVYLSSPTQVPTVLPGELLSMLYSFNCNLVCIIFD